MIISDRLLTEARRQRHPCMLLECVRIPRTCAEIWSSRTANMNNDLMKNHQLACEGDPIPRACAEKMKLSEPQNGSILRVSSQNVIRVCHSSVWEIHEPVRKMHSNEHLREGCFVQKQMKWSNENHKITHFRLMSRAIVHIFSVSWLASSLSLTSNTFTSWKFLLALEREHNYWNEHLFQKHSKPNPKEAYVLKEFKIHEPVQENGSLTTNIHRRKGSKSV